MFSRSILRATSQAALRSTGARIITNPRVMIPTVSPIVSVVKRSYHEKVIDHYENPRNVGTLNKNDINVGTGLVGAPACGDVMRLQIKVDEATGRIEDVKFKTFGCGSAIASSSYATELVKGKTLDEALQIKNTFIAQELSLPPVKLHCSMLAEDAIKSAVKDYKSKRSGLKPTLGPDAVASAGVGATAAPAAA
ncbi:iron sulfur cluster assembly protein 1, mitochondrial precursor [Spathaspora passalidarum NRRL Y-27907]|uniref:Iron-sulfur cluster assembly protein n=1 Tax=Spathaspora passalidarum (strain NRRL Y-27907 / 11-Y1) TaxID=619300 RepID=G3AVX5_SPAPN|nr:iron sulfur cluster assembly protein 1, mitochondrial precursor [Spathaspora passalidarum NRRL Y-27907]EGW30020.1 iron sulfur cluster assembly protein 1, mitochondrial precursor [Spathaspora passalidarum NRRL Y-27907]